MLRAVLDTNVLVSALIGAGKPRQLWRAALGGIFIPVISKELLAEFLEVLDRKRFETLDTSKIKRFSKQLIRVSIMTGMSSSYKIVKEDPEDNMVINTAYSGKAKYIVTGDSHLLRIGKFKGIGILSVDSFLQVLQSVSM